MSVGMYEPDFDGTGLRIGIVQSRFNEDICHGLAAACLAELKYLGVDDQDVLVVTVPGALEIPLALQKMAESRMAGKGADAARVAVEMANMVAAMEELADEAGED